MSTLSTAHPTRDLVTRGLVPSTLGHALLLLGLAAAGAHEVMGTRYFEVELEPEPARPATAAAPFDSSEPLAPSAPAGEGSEPSAMPAGASEPVVGTSRGGGSGTGAPAFVAAAARAGRVLTSPEASPAGDALDFSMVQGQGDRYAGGVTTKRGTSAGPVYDPGARDEGVAGVVGGHGSGGPGPAPAAAAKAPARRAAAVDKSRSPLPVSHAWSCPFPAEADAAKVNFARVKLVVTVGTNGRARSAVVLADPGSGFGQAAQRCAMGQRYGVGLDAAGQPLVATTAPITVTFTR